jgi:hypothetical protein
MTAPPRADGSTLDPSLIYRSDAESHTVFVTSSPSGWLNNGFNRCLIALQSLRQEETVFQKGLAKDHGLGPGWVEEGERAAEIGTVARQCSLAFRPLLSIRDVQIVAHERTIPCLLICIPKVRQRYQALAS